MFRKNIFFLFQKNSKSCSNKYSFTISYHFYGIKHCKNHWDVFINLNNKSKLLHYYINKFSYKKDISIYKNILFKGFLHRRRYLTYSGKVTKNRGTVKVIYKGILTSDILLSYKNYPKKMYCKYKK